MPSRQNRRALLDDFDGFSVEFRGESDRGMALLGAAFLEECLRSLIASFLIDDKAEQERLLDNPLSALGSFDARISASLCLGLLSQDESTDLRTIKKIRNAFAHNLHGMSFATDEIAEWCLQLKLRNELASSVSDLSDSPRDRFLTDVFILWYSITSRTSDLEHRPIPLQTAVAEILAHQLHPGNQQKFEPNPS